MRLNYKRAQRRQNLGEDMHIDEVEEVPLGTLYFFLQAVHPLVLHIQHILSWTGGPTIKIGAHLEIPSNTKWSKCEM